MSERRFSDKETNAIIQRATDLQMETSADKSAGATLSQIQQAASELGISPELVQKAAGDVLSAPVTQKSGFFGAPTRAGMSVIAEGTMTSEDMPAFLHEVRRVTGRVGAPNPIGNAFEWTSKSPIGMHISVMPKNGKSYVDVRTEFSEIAAGLVAVPLAFSVIFGLIITAAAGFAVGLPVLVAAMLTVFFAGRALYGRASRRKAEETRVIAEALKTYIEAEPHVLEASSTPIQEAEELKLRLTS